PVVVVLQGKLPAGPLANDVKEPSVQRQVGGEGLECVNDLLGALLDVIHLEALVIEAVNGIFIPPLPTALGQELQQLLVARGYSFQCVGFVLPFLPPVPFPLPEPLLLIHGQPLGHWFASAYRCVSVMIYNPPSAATGVLLIARRISITSGSFFCRPCVNTYTS